MFSLKMKKNLAILLAFLLIPVVFAQFSLPKIDPKLPSINIPTQPVYETYKPTIPTPPPIKIKICDEGKTMCRENSFFVCSKNSWQLKQECKFDEVCDSNKGCFKKQFTQPSLSVVKQFPEIKPVEGVPYIPQVCREGDLKCSGIRSNAVMFCQDNEWIVKQKCSSNEECVSGKGCVKKITDAKFPDYSKNYPKPPTPTSAPIDLGCEKIGEHTCFGSLFLTCKDTQLGRIWTDGKECSKPDFCDKAKGCLFSQLPKVSIPVKKPLVSSCGAGDKKCSDNGKELLACSNGEWVTEQKCGERYVCENNKCVPEFETKRPEIINKRELEEELKRLEEKLNTSGDDAQLANVDLQNMLQKQQQLLQMLSNISKNMHDTAMAVVRNMQGLTSEESQEGETSSKKKLSKEEINEIIEDVEEQQEELKDRRQRALTYFQNVDQKTNQMYNMLASVLKTMNEMSGVGVSSRSSALTSEEAKKAQKEAEELIKEAEQNVEQAREEYKKVLKALQEIQDLKIQATQAISETSSQEEKNVMQELLEALKESQEDMEEDKEYYLEKLEEYNKMGEELADYLGDLVDASTALSEQANRDIKTDLIGKLISKIKQGDVDAVSQLLLLLSKKSKNEQEEIAKKLVSAMNELEQKQRKLSEQLSSLNKEDKSQAQKLADLNKELNRISLSRQAITNVLRDTMQMQEEIAETTKSVLDTQGRRTRQTARIDEKEKTEEEYWSERTRNRSDQGEYLAESVKELSEKSEKLSTARAVDTSSKKPNFVVGVWDYLSRLFSKTPLISLSDQTNEDIESPPAVQSVSCNEQGLYYGCNNPPYTTPESCAQPAIEYYSEEGYASLSLNCCTQASWGWNCYLNGEQPVCNETELYYGCNNPPYTTQQSCGREGVRYYTGEGHQDVVLSCCTQADWGWNCYFNEQSVSQQQSTCNEEGLYYGCNNPPYATSDSCGVVGVNHYQNEGYANVSFNCCTQAVWGWNCYINGQQPAQESYVTTCICTGNNCQPIES